MTNALPDLTVNEFAARYLEDYAKVHKSSWREDLRRINRNVLPYIGKFSMSEVTRGQVSQMHSILGRHATYEANRTLEIVRRMFEVAIEWGVLPESHANPARRIKRFPEFPREIWVREHEMEALIASINKVRVKPIRIALFMLLVTGCRMKEILSLKWSDIDFSAEQITVRRINIKTRRTHVIPITPLMRTLIDELPRSSIFVFPSRTGRGHILKMSRTWMRVRRRAGLEQVQLRDLRHTAASWLANDGVSLYVIQKVLNHTTPRCTQIYAKLQTKPVREALQRYHEKLMPSA